MSLRRAVLLSGVRTPFAKAGGAFDPLSAADLARLVLSEALARSTVDPSAIGHVVLGCGGGPSEAANVARVAALRAGIPREVPAFTVQRNCASGMEAVAQAALLVETGRADVVLCGGTESMSGYPVEMPASFRRKLGAWARAKGALAKVSVLASLRPADLGPEFALLKGLTDPTCGLNMGETAEVLAREFGISRDRQDVFAAESHRRAAASRAVLAQESMVVAVTGARGTARLVDRDDAVRDDQSVEKLARLRPVFERRHGTVTAGNACGVTDGACALLVASEDWAARHGQPPLARIAATAVAGVAPERMGLGPCAALPRALAAAGWGLADLGLVEINEAFAVQVLACLEVMASDELSQRHAGVSRAPGRLDPSLLNVNGGAIALGHPVGVSGARLVLTLALEMKRRQVARGAATLCVGGGQGQAVLLESLA